MGGPSHLDRLENAIERDAERKRILTRAKEEFASLARDDVASVCRQLGVDPAAGLSKSEVQSRLEHAGPNELTRDPPPTFWQLLLDQFKDILVWMLIIAMLISAAQGHVPETVTLLCIIVFNSLLGVKMEMGAGAALEALQSSTPPLSQVRREGVLQEVPSSSLVPGDIVILPLGKTVPADVRLTMSAGLAANEASLTGEPEPVKKDASWRMDQPSEGKSKKESTTYINMVYMGCMVQEGTGEGVVIRTGMATEIGKIAHLLAQTGNVPSPLQRRLKVLGTRMALMALFVSCIVLIVGISTGRGSDPDTDTPAWLQMISVTIALTIACMPEALPVSVTMCLAAGMTTLAKVHKAQIQKLKSVETLGSASVICTDKTGTLTKGEMTAVRLWCFKTTLNATGVGYDPEGFIVPADTKTTDPTELEAEHVKHSQGLHRLPALLGVICNNAEIKFDEKEGQWTALGNSTDRPLVVLAKKAGYDKATVDKSFPRVHCNPFSSVTKMMATVNEVAVASGDAELFFPQAKYIVAVKGAPNNLLKRCSRIAEVKDGAAMTEGKLSIVPLGDEEKQNIMERVDYFSSQALRVLALAYRIIDSPPDEEEAKDLENDLIFTGLIGSIDPERPEVGPSIYRAQKVGVRVVMITGDYLMTAKAIAENIGLLPRNSPLSKAVDCEVIRELGEQEAKLDARIRQLRRRKRRGIKPEEVGHPFARLCRWGRSRDEELSKEEEEEDELSQVHEEDLKLLTRAEEEEIDDEIARLKAEALEPQKQLDALTRHADVYARALPKDKITIVASLQRQGNICSMTGDGVNDAPALKKADIGVAMGITGTDVAKAAADMVLLNDSFVSILAAVEQGRVTYSNIQKFVYYLLSTNGAEVVLIFIAICLGLQSPLSPVQLIWLNATDILPTIALALEPPEPGIMNEGPRAPKEPLLDRVVLTGIAIHVPVLTGVCLGTYIIGLYWETNEWDALTLRRACEKEEPGACGDYNHAVTVARTMTIMVIIFGELFRAYSSRSLRLSWFQLGLWGNKWLQWSVVLAVGITLLFVLIPALQSAFQLADLEGKMWGWVWGMSFVPLVVEEVVKFVYRLVGFGKRPVVVMEVEEPEKTGKGEEGVAVGSGDGIAPGGGVGRIEEKDFIRAAAAADAGEEG